jgi:hypothetical protein
MISEERATVVLPHLRTSAINIGSRFMRFQ